MVVEDRGVCEQLGELNASPSFVESGQFPGLDQTLVVVVGKWRAAYGVGRRKRQNSSSASKKFGTEQWEGKDT